MNKGTVRQTENKITAAEFAAELMLLLKDYFICETGERGDKISVRFQNGQEFELNVTQK